MIRYDRMRILTDDGVIDTLVFTDAAASSIGSYWNAVRHYLHTGDTSRLDEFEGQNINLHRFLTDPDLIDELARIGELDVDSIYEDGSGS
jgi:hypothetical protein